MNKNNQLWNRYFLRLQRISYWYRETPRCPNIYIIDLNKFLLLFLLTITKQKYFSSSPNCYLIILSLNLPYFLWFDLSTLRIILLRSFALWSEQAILAPLSGSCCVFKGNLWKQSTTGGNSSIGNFVAFFFPYFVYIFFFVFIIFYLIVDSLLHAHLG